MLTGTKKQDANKEDTKKEDTTTGDARGEELEAKKSTEKEGLDREDTGKNVDLRNANEYPVARPGNGNDGAQTYLSTYVIAFYFCIRALYPRRIKRLVNILIIIVK